MRREIEENMKVCKCPYVDENSEHLTGCIHSRQSEADNEIIKLQAMQLIALRAQLAQGAPYLRDQFAMAAIGGIIQHANASDVNDFPKRFARWSYLMADAMLEARKVKP